MELKINSITQTVLGVLYPRSLDPQVLSTGVIYASPLLANKLTGTTWSSAGRVFKKNMTWTGTR